MKFRTLTSLIVASSVMIAGLASTSVFADDGQRLVRSVSSPPGLEEDPEPEGEHAFISLMNFRVPTQRANGDVEPVEYYNIDDVLTMTLESAKPLINVFVYGPVDTFDDFSQSGFPGHGRRDAFGAVSLDDGETWKATNLSNSGDKSSFTIQDPIPDPGEPEGSGTLIVVDDPDGAAFTEATWQERTRSTGKLDVAGTADSRERVTIRNAVSQEPLFVVRADRTGEFDKARRLEVAPCWVQAGVDGVFGPAMEVVDSRSGLPLEDCDSPDVVDVLITEYPGDVTNVFHSTAGNRVLVAWQSKLCGEGGFPGYALDDTAKDDLATYLEIDIDPTDGTADLYLEDLFVVGGSQQSVDYREQEEFEGEYDDVAEVPYNCLWSARGVLREDPVLLGTTELVWFQAERLTSGRRDVNRVETKCVAGAGCAISWQEDPEGLRPGEGEGPGTGWAGATTASQTDVWYSFIEWEDMDIVDLGDNEPAPLADNILDTGRPQPYVPMMVPVRLTNNARCPFPVTGDANYCEEDFAGPYGIKNQCIGTIQIPLGPQQELRDICVVDNNNDDTMNYGDLPNIANTASSRPRLNMQPRDSDGDGFTDDAWVIIIHEEDKGLGRYGFPNDVPWDGSLTSTGVTCGDPDESLDDNCIEADIGKNEWYISFALGSPQTSVLDEVDADTLDYSMLSNIVEQQNQFNAPEVNWITGTYYPPNPTEQMWDFGELNYLIMNNEIARRASMMSQSVVKAEASANKLVAMPLFKEGIIRQGGPADIMARRVVLPDDWTNEQSANPYDFANMVCEWYDGEGTVTEGRLLFDPASTDANPYYPKGLCGAPAINLSARTPHECEASGLSDGVCAGAADMTCEDDGEFGQLCLSTTDPSDNQLLDKMLSWYECPGWDGTDVSNGGNTGASTIPATCYSELDSQLLQANLDDRSWYMPTDVAKAHRGFLDGDHVAMIYGWSPNWKQNSVGQDRYELYIRRSFDGGLSWTVMPETFTASDGLVYDNGPIPVVTCETWRDGADSTTDSHICTEYLAAAPEQSRNLTQHKSMKITTLDPRYTPTIASMAEECPTWYQDELGGCLSEWLLWEPITGDDTTESVDPTDVRNPSRHFVVYETGDNTTVAVGEAEPLNLEYGRAEFFGDYYTVWAETDTDTANLDLCYPNDPHGTTDVDWATGTGFCNEFDTLEGFPLSLSSEASITSSAYGDFLYGVWGQFNVEEVEDPDTGETHLEFIDGDSMFRRVWYLDDYISDTNAWTLPGLSGGDG